MPESGDVDRIRMANLVNVTERPHSWRNASMGSMSEARRVGR